MIEGVVIKVLKRIPDDRGKILHVMKNSDDEYNSFGEVYCSTVYPGIVKGWHLHKEMTLNYAVLKGKIKFVLFDSRKESETYGETQVVYIGEENYVRVTVPPLVWNGFMGVGLKESFVINFTDIPHDPNEIERMDPHNNEIIDYDWSIKDR
jgi:dTDP-4-dehydrorhamnose 3,5-epimerase